MNANLITRKIEMTKNEAKAAGKINTQEFNDLRVLMEMYPGYEIQIKAPTKRTVELKGLDYNYMRTYIQKCDKENKDAIMDEFNTLIAKDKKDGKKDSEHLVTANYLVVRKWFLKTFPEIRQKCKDHKAKVQKILTEAA